MPKLLLATLGQTPAVVTGALDCLRAEGVVIDAVIVLASKGKEVREGIELLRTHLPEYYQGRTILLGERVMGTQEDVDSEEAALEFMFHACSVLRDYRKQGYDIYVSIAGGRKAMSALMALAVQFYGAQRLFHVVVKSPEVESRAHISILKRLPLEEQLHLLHPPIEQMRIVDLPFIGLFPFLQDILAGLRGEEVRAEIRELLEQNGLLNGRVVTPIGHKIRYLLEEVQVRPRPRRGACRYRITVPGDTKRKEVLEQWAREIEERFDFVESIETIEWGEKLTISVMLPNRIAFAVPGIANVGFLLATTAQTPGELQYARQEIERWFTKGMQRRR